MDIEIKKVRPEIKALRDYGEDGRDSHWYIQYKCPTCGRIIRNYRADTACDQCGTFYDWGNRPPKLVYSVTAQWD